MNSIEKEFAPYQEALELKELGFNELCFKEFHYEKMIGNSTDSEITNSEMAELYSNNAAITAPTFSQAFRWFRLNHNLHAAIYPIKQHWECDIRYTNKNVNNSIFTWNDEFTYEEAEIACLRKLIELVKLPKPF
jgi:hypothetical protein